MRRRASCVWAPCIGRTAALVMAAGLLAVAGSWPVVAQERPAAPPTAPAATDEAARPSSSGEMRGRRGRPGAGADEIGEPRRRRAERLPQPSITHHKLELPGRTLEFTATAEAIPLMAESGEVTGEIAVIAYTRDGVDAARRPVTFAMNGGPGSASAWVHLGLMGPWRLPLDGDAARPSAAPVLVANAETWLDFTDLVFIDPVGTGYSRTVGDEEARKKAAKFYYSVNGDIESISAAMRIWLARHRRTASPKLFAGESYAGFRAPKIARKLATEHGIGLSGVMMISPVIDFGLGRRGRRDPLSIVTALPSQAAAAADRKGEVTAADLARFEAYARGELLVDVMKGERDTAAVERIVRRVTELTGLDPALVARLKGRIDRATFMRELDRAKGLVGSAYDATVGGIDPYPASASLSLSHDTFTTALTAPVTSAMLGLYADRLNWRPQRRYLLSGSLIRQWDWGSKRVANEAAGDLEAILALDPRLRVLVSHGYADLVTPYFASRLVIDQIAAAPSAARVKLSVYGGGHMFYSRAASRQAYRAEVEALVKAVSRQAD
ncbi:MAG: peptidase S10 [Hyphomicrobiaceae bacterium]